ncbi:MAG TPA: tRNA pseudouridine(55) synthase TruB, partial [Bacillota bacterium]|nr:tRNA pseudouridine(55) synthase TruB [Bacillota bacterium]
DTGDTGGKVISEYSGTLPGFDEFCAAAKTFSGEIMQVPPMYSALKVNGQKLVDLARKGIEVERSARRITVYSIVPREADGVFFIDVSCSRGTYIRTLCEDIGNSLGCGAAMASLRRARVGEFTLDNAYTPEALEAMSAEEREACAIPIADVFSRFRSVTLEPFYERLARNGAEIYLSKAHIMAETGEMLKLYGADGFFALGEVRDYPDGSAVKPVTMFL